MLMRSVIVLFSPQEMMREEAEHRQKKDDMWSAVEPAMATATSPTEEASGNIFGGGSTSTETAATSESGAQPGDGPRASSLPGVEGEGRSTAPLLASSSVDAGQRAAGVGGPSGAEVPAGRDDASAHDEASSGNAEESLRSSAGGVVDEAGGEDSAVVSCSVEETEAASSPDEGDRGLPGKGSAAREEGRDSTSLASATQGKSAVVENGATHANSVDAGADVASALTAEEGLGSGSDGAFLQPAEDEDEANSSMEVDDNEEEVEEEEEGEGEGGSSSNQAHEAPTGGEEANGGGVANGKAASTGGSGRATRQGTRQGPRHGGIASEI